MGGEFFLCLKKNLFGSKKILGQTNVWVKKLFGLRKIFGSKFFLWVEKFWGLKKIWTKRSLGRKILGVEKKFGPKEVFELIVKSWKHFVKEVF